MSEYSTHGEIVHRIGELSDKLSRGSLSEEELLEFEGLSRDLYERVVILNYKAKESKVYTRKNGEVDHKEQEAKKPEEKEDKKEALKKTRESESFSGEIAFDFSTPQTEMSSMKAAPVDALKTTTLDEEKEKVSSKTEVSSDKNETETTDRESFIDRFKRTEDNSLMNKLAAKKIESLKGAIGLNDKMQFISELFNKDADLFNKTIDSLDNQESHEAAIRQLSKIAVEQNWDSDSSIVEDFVKLIDRRYAK
ncbi:MAG: hypothetical protein R3277_03005 [Brumimicrobium sp.]|nr:hypothetical protein [Brumimicrobium sp.]